MAPSFDCAVSSLLCAEDNNCIFDYDVKEDFERIYHRNHQICNKNRVFDGCLCLPMQSEECLNTMINTETQHLPNADYLKRLKNGDFDLGARNEAIDWIQKVCSQFGFGPITTYLSINYLDRFLSAYELPKGKAWMMQLLAVACLSIAAKMEETEVPFSLDLQVGESKFIFDAKTIRRMELLVLSTLNWRMQAITPFSFIRHFLNKIDFDQTSTASLVLSSIHLILCTIRGIELLEYKPSEIAAAVAIAVVGQIKGVDAEHAISVLAQHVHKERVVNCIKEIEDLSLISGCPKPLTRATFFVPQSPVGVLEAACFSFRSDESTHGSSPNTSPIAKKRKLK